MSTLAEHCLDGWDAVTKKTSRSLEGLKGLQGLMKQLNELFHKFSSDTASVCAKYKAKHAQDLEGTVKASLLALVDAIESAVVDPHQLLAEQFNTAQKELASFHKEHEKTRKKLLADAASARKDYDSALAALKKARDAYCKAAKDAASQRQSASKSPEKASKAQAAEEKAKSADKAYGDQLVDTNDRQHRYYTAEQPALLAQVQQWEEDRVEFVKRQVQALAQRLGEADMSAHWQKLVSTAGSCAQDIDAKADMETYAQSIDTKVGVPSDIGYEPAPEGPSIGAPAALSTHGGASGSSSSSASSSYAAAAASSAAAAPAAAPASGGESKGEGEGEEYTALYDYEPANPEEMAMKEGEALRITDKDDSGWWYAVAADGREGYVPASYVQPK